MSFYATKCKQNISISSDIACTTNDTKDTCYLFGGAKSKTVQYSNDLFIATDDINGFKVTKINCQNSPPPTNGAGIIYHNNSLILFGGLLRGSCTNKFYVCDINNKIWKPLQITGIIPTPRSDFCFIKYDDYAVVFAGMNLSNKKWHYLSDLFVINLVKFHCIKITNSLKEINPISLFGYCIVKDQLVIAGGNSLSKRLNEMFCINLNDLIFGKINVKQIKQFDYTISHHRICSFNDSVFLFGGRQKKNVFTNENMIITNILTDNVKITKNILQNAPSERMSHSLVELNKKLFVFGGAVKINNKQIFYNDIYCLTFNEKDELKLIFIFLLNN